MTKPTETESLEALDESIYVLEEISHLAFAGKKKDRSSESPKSTSVCRIDEVKAARKPILSYR